MNSYKWLVAYTRVAVYFGFWNQSQITLYNIQKIITGLSLEIF